MSTHQTSRAEYHSSLSFFLSRSAASLADLPGLRPFHQRVSALWTGGLSWLAMSTCPPPWLPRRWRLPLAGYLVAIVLQLLLCGADQLLLLRYPDLTIYHLPLVLGVVIVALYWGVGPSLVATLTGALLLYTVILFTPLSWSGATETDVAELVLFLVICGAISALARQTQRARLTAEQARRAAEDLAASLAREHEQSELERRRLHIVLEVLPVGVCLVNATGQVLTRNQTERAIWGPWPPEALEHYGTVYQGWSAQTNQPLRPGDWPLGRALEHGQETRGEELVLQTPDGHRRTVLSAARPIFDAAGALVGAVATLLDITERKQLEESLRQAEREQLVRERQAAEARAQTLAEAKERMDAFLGIVSHELKTPVSSILLGLQLIRRRLQRVTRFMTGAAEQAVPTFDILQDTLEVTLQQVGRLNRLINDLLDTSRIQAGRLEFQFSSVDLVAVVRQVVEEQRQLFPERTIHLDLPGGEPVFVRADAFRVGQVLTNYLTNALKYSGEERPVEVGIQREAGRTRVWVRDKGPGIPPEEHAQLWERFHRVPGIEIQSGSGIGLGLGLHICRKILEHHGGQVGVESARGTGSTFWFSLPLDGPEPPDGRGQ